MLGLVDLYIYVDDVIGIFGKNTCHTNENQFHFNEVELMIFSVRKLVSEPKWTRIRPSLKQKLLIDYIITDAQLLEVSQIVHVNGTTDTGTSDHFLVWMKLGHTSMTSKKRKCVINPRRACAERVTVVVSCVCLSVCMYVCPNTLFWQYAQLEV